MSEQYQPDQDSPPASAIIDRIGPVLVAAREKLGMSAEDISNRLRLSMRQVHALENDDFAVLPEAVITRGFIRNYARLLEIDAAPLLNVYSQYVPVQEDRAISIPSANIVISGEAGTSWRPYVLFGGLLVLLLCGWILYVDFFQNRDPGVAVIPESLIEEEVAVEGAGVDIPAELELPAASIAPATTAEFAQPAQQSAESASNTAVIASPQPQENAIQPEASAGARLKFSVGDTTWISITDASGKQIANKTLAANSEEIVTGQPPFNIVIGNATGTKLEYNEKSVDLVPHTKINVARLTLE